MVRTFKIYSLSSFQIYNRVLLTLITTLYIRVDFLKEFRPKGNKPWTFIGRTDAETPIIWPPDAKSWLIGKDPDVGKDEVKRRGWQSVRCLDSITNSMGMNMSKLREIAKDTEAWHPAVRRVAKRRKQFSNWTTTTNTLESHDIAVFLLEVVPFNGQFPHFPHPWATGKEEKLSTFHHWVWC